MVSEPRCKLSDTGFKVGFQAQVPGDGKEEGREAQTRDPHGRSPKQSGPMAWVPGNNPQRKLKRLGDAGIAKYADPETRFSGLMMSPIAKRVDQGDEVIQEAEEPKEFLVQAPTYPVEET
jgi:hypothetical protein